MENQTEPKPTYKDREILKRAERHAAFMQRFAFGFYIHVSQSRQLIRGMINDHETHHCFALHHRINKRVETMATPKLEVVFIKNDRT